MPKIIDHEQRRAEIVQIVLSVVSRDGLAGATMRRIAKEGGFTSGVLSHYFTTKEEMINFVFDAVAEATYRRIDERLTETKGGLAKARVTVEELLPLDHRETESVMTIVFWNSAMHDNALKEQFDRRYGQWREYLTSALSEAVELGEIVPPADMAQLVDMIIAATDGMLVSWTLQPERFDARARQDRITTMFASLTPRQPEEARAPKRRVRA